MWLCGRFFRSMMLNLVVGLGVVGSLLNVTQQEVHAMRSADAPETAPHFGDTVPSPAAYPTITDSAGYMVPRARFLATVFHAVEERQSLSSGDHVVIDAGGDQHLQVGDWFTIVRQSAARRHPVTEQAVGSLIATLGYAVAVRVQPSAAVLRLTKTFDAVELGDRVIRFEPRQNDVTRAALSPTSRDLKGHIIATKEAKVSVGEGDIVYLDQGQTEGVRVGDRFNVFREGDRVRHPVTRRLIRLPHQIFGEVTVLDVRPHTATALVTSSLRELSTGAPIELQDRQILEAAAPPHATAPDHGVDQTETRLTQLLPCLEVARQALHAAEVAGAPEAQLALAGRALSRAEQRSEQAQAALAQHDVERARGYLDAAQADCLTAQELSQYVAPDDRPSAAPERYTVRRGDTLWGISGQTAIYQEPLMWPLLYRTNREQIHDPDLIFPKQILTIPRNASQEEVNTATQRARKRGPWRLGDGPDVYILEGIRP